MLPKDHELIIRSISTNLTDQGKVNDLLQQLRDSNDTEHSAYEKLTSDFTTATEQIGTLKENNMNLFLKVGHTKVESTTAPEPTGKSLEELALEIK